MTQTKPALGRTRTPSDSAMAAEQEIYHQFIFWYHAKMKGERPPPPLEMKATIKAIIDKHKTPAERVAPKMLESLEACEGVMNVSANQLCTPVDSNGQNIINKRLVECVIRTRATIAEAEETD